jgi:hypothetical protein
MALVLGNRHSKTTEGVVNGKSGRRFGLGVYWMMGETNLAALDFDQRNNAKHNRK